MPIKLKNTAFSDTRLRIVPDVGTTLKIDHTDNPCVAMSVDGNELFACLGPMMISCVGAIDNSGPMRLDGKFNVNLNGVAEASNMSALELIEHFKDHPDIEVGIYEETLLGAPYVGTYRTEYSGEYLPNGASSVTAVTGGSIKLHAGEGDYADGDINNGWVAVQIIDTDQKRYSMTTPLYSELASGATSELQEYSELTIGDLVVKILYGTEGFAVSYANNSGEANMTDPVAIAVVSNLAFESIIFGEVHDITSLTDMQKCHVMVGELVVDNRDQ